MAIFFEIFTHNWFIFFDAVILPLIKIMLRHAQPVLALELITALLEGSNSPYHLLS